MRFDVTTRASPEQVRQALTDFTDQRLRTWSRTLDPKGYELRGLGDTWALARESSPGSPFWVVARYAWSQPDVISWTIEESSYGGGGQGSVHIATGPNGGSQLQVQWVNLNVRPMQKPLMFVLHHGPMSRVISRAWASALDRYAEANPF